MGSRNLVSELANFRSSRRYEIDGYPPEIWYEKFKCYSSISSVRSVLGLSSVRFRRVLKFREVFHSDIVSLSLLGYKCLLNKCSF